MSGYVFSTSFFVFIYLIVSYSLYRIDIDHIRTVIPHSIAAGFLYWVHPTGLAVIIASIIVMAIANYKARKIIPVVIHITLMTGMLALYEFVIHSHLYQVATPNGYSYIGQYPSYLYVLSKMPRLDFLSELPVRMIGQLSYLGVASFGLIHFGIFGALNIVTGRSQTYDRCMFFPSERLSRISLFLLLSLFMVIAMGSAVFVAYDCNGVQYWIYGRYAEAVVLPILALGISFHYKLRWIIFSAIFVMISGLLLAYVAHPTLGTNFINTISFWPQYIFNNSNYILWMIIGGAGILIFGFIYRMGWVGRVIAIGIFVAVASISIFESANFHKHILTEYSKPSSFVDVIRRKYPPGTCIGFDVSTMAGRSLYYRERYKLLLFYLYDYDYRRIRVDEWMATCDGGLLFTYSLDHVQHEPNVILLGREKRSMLYLIAKKSSVSPSPKWFAGTEDVQQAHGWNVLYDLHYADESLGKLPRQVGYFNGDYVRSDGRGGFLLYGPYVYIDAGNYCLVIEGNASSTSTAWVDVVSNKGTIQHAKFPLSEKLSDAKDILVLEQITLKAPVHDLEVRVHVGTVDEVQIEGYKLESTND